MSQSFVLHAGDEDRPLVLGNLHAFLDDLDENRSHRIVIKRYVKERTTDANAYLWGVVYVHVVRELGHTDEDWHTFMCCEFFGEVVVEALGRTQIKPRRTTTTDENGDEDVLEGPEFWDFVEHVRRRAAEGGVYVPDPDPSLKRVTA